ncbi:MAG: hypothetical protein WCL14_08130 [Bacteroidota bacterium]
MAYPKRFFILFSMMMIYMFSTIRLSQAQVTYEQGYEPVIYGGVGVLGFDGNIGKVQKLSIFSDNRLGYNFGFEELVGQGFGIGLEYLGGQLQKNERSLTANNNFQSDIMSIGLNVTYHFDNDVILPIGSMVAPYVNIGFHYLTFKSSSDMIAANGENYYYWNDGSVRNIRQLDTIGPAGVPLPMDHKYETDLHSLALSTENLNYSQTSFAIPIGIGVAFKLVPELSVDLKATYYLTMTHYIDYVAGTGMSGLSNDAYLYTNVSLHYNFGLTTTGTAPGKQATTTPDDDSYYSSAKNSKIQPKSNPSGNSAKTTTSTPAPSSNNIPADLKVADTNNDGKISTQEINAAIDALFNGDKRYSVSMINKLIDYFFEQH